MFKLTSSPYENLLFFKLEGEATERHGAVGYLRADFGSNGREFWTTWFDNQPHLKTPEFKSEFDSVINSLRDDGSAPPFASRANLAAFCNTTPGKDLTVRGNGYLIQTMDYSYFFRLFPRQGDYDIYCFAYENRFLLPELAGEHDMPDSCFSIHPSTGEIILVRLGQSSCPPIAYQTGSRELNRIFVDSQNAVYNITRGQEAAMLAGSLHGWGKPAANPWRYDGQGNCLPQFIKKNEPER